MMQKSHDDRMLWAQFDSLEMGTGWDDTDIEKPQIMVESVYGDSHPGSWHLNQLVEQAVYGVYEKGGKPAKYYATDICDGCAQGHDGMNVVLASREALANMVEVHASAVPWDGMILMSSCDKSIPAHLKAAARMDIPTIFMPGGSMRPGPNMTTSLVAGDISLRQKRKDAITPQEVRDYKLTGCPSVGACTFLGTASTMQCIAEALGMTLPGAALAPATMRDIIQYARYAGRKIMELVEKDITASKIMTPAAFKNAIIVHSAIGGSTNATIHLPSIARELGYDLPIELFDEINHQVPHLGNIFPSGAQLTESFWFAGGIPMVQWMLRDMLDLDVMTVTGKTLGENLEDLHKDNWFARNLGYLANYGLTRDQVIFPVEKAPEKGSVAILKGNIAPEGSVLKYSACAMNQREVVNAKARVFNHEEESLRAFREKNEALRKAGTGAQSYAATMIPAVVSISYVNYALVAVLGGIMALKGMTDVGSLASYLVFVRQAAMPINQMTQQSNFLLAALAGAERVFEVLEQPPETDEGQVELVNVKEEGGTMTACAEKTGRWAWRRPDGSLAPLRGDVRFQKVDFGYEAGQPILKGISLYAEPGQKIAFVGSTGAGKTTITNLINRFYEVQGGGVTYDGIDVRDIKKDSLRRSLGIVLQDTHLFTGTIADNIRFGKLDATQKEIERAARIANADSFIRRLPQVYETMVTSDGANLSQGQRQLLAIARAAVADPPVLILDEATSSIDTRTEALIEKGMDQLMEGRTVFVIAHRLSTVRNSDAIMVLDHGRIVERGDHEDLIRQHGLYYQLYTGAFELE